MIVRISEIEVYPEHLTEYLEFAHNVGATSVKEEPEEQHKKSQQDE